MKHIRLFEGFNEDDYYVRIEYEDIDEEMDSDIISFTKKKEAKKLAKSLGTDIFFTRENSLLTWLLDLGYDGYEFDRKPKLKTRVGMVKDYGDNYQDHIDIWEAEDEFYIVFIDSLHNDDSIDDGKFYKCDQWDGLVKLLKDKLVK